MITIRFLHETFNRHKIGRMQPDMMLMNPDDAHYLVTEKYPDYCKYVYMFQGANIRPSTFILPGEVAYMSGGSIAGMYRMDEWIFDERHGQVKYTLTGGFERRGLKPLMGGAHR